MNVFVDEKGPCFNCPDRVPEPNCHMTCKKYINYEKERKARNTKIFNEKQKEMKIIAYRKEAIERERRR